MKEKSAPTPKVAKTAKTTRTSGEAPRNSKTSVTKTKKAVQTTNQDQHQMIRMEAYFRSEQRGFEAGAELQDWFEAEQEIRRRQADSQVNTDTQ